MSKVFSLAGLRLGWIATHDEAALAAFRSHRDYDLISCGMFDEAVAAIALSHKDKLIARNTGIVRTNLAILDDWVNSSEHFFYTKPQAGTTALVYYDFDIPSYDFCTRMYHETGAFVTPGDCFEQPRSMRIGYASDTETLKAGLARDFRVCSEALSKIICRKHSKNLTPARADVIIHQYAPVLSAPGSCRYCGNLSARCRDTGYSNILKGV